MFPSAHEPFTPVDRRPRDAKIIDALPDLLVEEAPGARGLTSEIEVERGINLALAPAEIDYNTAMSATSRVRSAEEASESQPSPPQP